MTDFPENKHRPLVIASLTWQPFDSRFEEILQRMESHRTLLKEVLDLDYKRITLEAHEKMEREWEAAKTKRYEAGNSEGNGAERAETEQREQQEERRKAEIARLDQVEHRFAEERERMLAEKARFEARRVQEALGKSVEKIIEAQRGKMDYFYVLNQSNTDADDRCGHPSYPGLAFTTRIRPGL
jgi:DNA anti-recombination protein RmuC